MAALLALTAAACFGASDFMGGWGSREHDPKAIAFGAQIGGFILSLVLLAVVGGEWSVSTAVFGVLGGIAGAAGLLLMFQAFAIGQFQLVSPLVGVTSGVVPVVAGIVLGDRPESLAVAGMVLVAPAVWLLSGGTLTIPKVDDPKPLSLALASGLGFGLFFVLLAQTPDGAGAVPLVFTKLGGVATMAIVAKSAGINLAKAVAIPIALGSGLIDMGANAFFLWATREGDLSVVGALVALFPAPNAAFAWVFLKERLTSWQWIGFGFALGAAALLGA
jgi:uncharacterized membrane protein